MSLDKQQKVVVVTGAAGGIGSAIVRRAAAGAFAVAIWDLSHADGERLAGEITKEGGRALAVPCDIADPASVQAAAEMTRSGLGSAWGLVNNAGIDRFGLFKDNPDTDWEPIIAVNLKGTLNCTKALLDDMIAAGSGRIVFLSSDAARVGSTGEAVYAASKAGVIGFAKALAREVARYGIAVNTVCPGPTDTALLDAVRKGPRGDKIMDAVARSIPMGRIARPDDIAGAVAFFLSPDAAYITGQTLSVSGGLTMV